MNNGTQSMAMEATQVASESKFKYYVELTKPRITTMVLIYLTVHEEF